MLNVIITSLVWSVVVIFLVIQIGRLNRLFLLSKEKCDLIEESSRKHRATIAEYTVKIKELTDKVQDQQIKIDRITSLLG